MRKEAELEMQATVGCTIELPEGTRFDEAFAIVEDEYKDWLAEEGRIELSFGTAGGEARTWHIKDVDVAIAIDS